ncbi:MAG: hypothetical protein WCA89_13995 [Terracidiphilus sp.]|jgi:hypothetical protein
MNPKFAVSLLCLSLFSTLHAWALPDSCGKEGVQFKVTTQPIPIDFKALDAGKAQIVFLESEMTAGMVLNGAETRLGVDGAWVGATKGNSYFSLSLIPGQHHLCANWPADFAPEWALTGLASLNAKPGEVYYYRIKIRHIRLEQIDEHSLDLSPVNEDEGKYLVNFLDQATATVKK